MNLLRLSSNEKQLTMWLGAASLFFAVFLKITSELFENEVQGLDTSLLMAVARMRSPWLSNAAMDITALGSVALVTVITVVALCILLVLRDRSAAMQLLLSLLGAGSLTGISKHLIERARPEDVAQIVQVSGFSYPSGHSLVSASLYLTLAILAGRHLRTAKARLLLFVLASTIISLVGLSRIYLGVHYPTDVISGISFGAAWSLLLTAIFQRWNFLGLRNS
jgi:undecaprenyl-diphosphatase